MIFLNRADRLMRFLTEAFPYVGKYGKEYGGDMGKALRALEKHGEMIDREIFRIDQEYERETKEANEIVRRAADKRNASLKALAEKL